MAVIRATTRADVSVLPAIEASAGEAFLALPDFAHIADGELMPVAEHTRLAALGSSWIATDPSGPIGFLAAEVVAEVPADRTVAGKMLHVWELSVHASAHGQGIGTQLMRHAMAEACDQLDCEGVTLTTFREVVFNAPFYARLGFEVLSEGALGERLQAVLAAEAAHGLRPEDRCAMRFLCAC